MKAFLILALLAFFKACVSQSHIHAFLMAVDTKMRQNKNGRQVFTCHRCYGCFVFELIFVIVAVYMCAKCVVLYVKTHSSCAKRWFLLRMYMHEACAVVCYISSQQAAFALWFHYISLFHSLLQTIRSMWKHFATLTASFAHLQYYTIYLQRVYLFQWALNLSVLLSQSHCIL